MGPIKTQIPQNSFQSQVAPMDVLRAFVVGAASTSKRKGTKKCKLTNRNDDGVDENASSSISALSPSMLRSKTAMGSCEKFVAIALGTISWI